MAGHSKGGLRNSFNIINAPRPLLKSRDSSRLTRLHRNMRAFGVLVSQEERVTSPNSNVMEKNHEKDNSVCRRWCDVCDGRIGSAASQSGKRNLTTDYVGKRPNGVQRRWPLLSDCWATLR
jgi:hypothetical protein